MTAPSTINTNHQTPRASAALSGGNVPTLFFEAGAPSPESSSPGAKHSAKAQAFWARKAALRKQPGRCVRCAKPHSGESKQCPACLAYAENYRAKRRVADHGTADAKTVAALEKRVANLEHYFAQLSAANRVAYNRGYCAGRRLHRKAQERASYFDALPRAEAQDLREMSHAYAR